MAERQSAEAMYHESGRAKRRACYRAAVRPVIPSPAGCGMEGSSEVTFKLTAYAVSSSRSRVVILSRADGEGSLFDRECTIRLRDPSSSARFGMTQRRSG